MSRYQLHVWGERACFPRGEFKRDVVTYDALSPMAARGMLDAIHWRPGMRWEVRRITILKPIRREIRRISYDGVANTPSSLSIHSLFDVGYLIDAEIILVDRPDIGNALKVQRQMFERRARRGRFFRRPYFGVRECPASFALVHGTEKPGSAFPSGEHDLGWLPYDARIEAGFGPSFFRATAVDGVMTMPEADDEGLAC